MKINSFLKQKAVEYTKFDKTRMPIIYEKVKSFLKIPKIIHIVGTNGKGSSGRFLAYYLFRSGLNIGHFTSPHILKINERFWLNNKNISDELLEKTHQKACKIFSKSDLESLSYFEYLTFLAIIYFEDVDFLILEAGLGGEFDSTSVFDNILTLVTPIDIDHKEFLGDSINKIATTKLKAIKHFAIIGYQPHKDEINRVCQEIKQTQDIQIKFIDEYILTDEYKLLKNIIKKINFAPFFTQNLSLALSAIKFLGKNINYSLFNDFKFEGRFQKISKNITIDVGHNPLAAKEIVKLYKNKKVILLYNTFFDKDYKITLNILKKIIKIVEIIDIKNPRIVKKEKLKRVLNNLKIDFRDFKKIDTKKEYLVFGSFSLIENFLKRYKK